MLNYKIYVDDVQNALKKMPGDSVDCVVTSPPYWGLRSYLKKDNSLKEFEIGTEENPKDYIIKIADIFDEIKRVIKPSGTCFLNLGDTYYGKHGSEREGKDFIDKKLPARANPKRRNEFRISNWLRPRQLLGIPWRIAIEMQSRGWILRNSLIWRKLNHMPSSVKNRLANSYEHIFFFVKNEKYYFNLDSVRVPHKTGFGSQGIAKGKRFGGNGQASNPVSGFGKRELFNNPLGGNPADFLSEEEVVRTTKSLIAPHRCYRLSGRTYPYKIDKNPGDFISDEPTDILETTLEPLSESHFASFPTSLPRFCLKAGCPKEVCSKCGKPREKVIKAKGFRTEEEELKLKRIMEERGIPRQTAGILVPSHSKKTEEWQECNCNAEFTPGIVLDPFLGSGTTLVVAQELGLNGIGIDLNPQFASIMLRRLNCRTKTAPNKYSNPISEVEFISDKEINYEPKKEFFYMPNQKKILEEKDA